MFKAVALLFAFLLPLSASGAEPVVDLNSAKVAHLYGEVNPLMDAKHALEVYLTTSIPGDRLVLINSPGGFIDAGQRIIDRMTKEQAQGVRQVCVVTGEAHSMAFNILTHCDVRIAYPGAKMLVHKVATTGIPKDIRGTARNLRRIAAILDQEDEPYRHANACAMHLTIRDYDSLADHETVWSAQTLLKRGYLHAIIKPKL